MNPNITLVVVIALIVGMVLGAAVIYAIQRARTKRLKERFGPEYSRVMEEIGNRSRAEAMLKHRQKRVKDLRIRALDAAERSRFQQGWREIQARFVDNPSGALGEADRLVGEVMSAEGYPTQEFEQRAADISVDHSMVIENYREGHKIAVNNHQGNATTEELRRGMIHYRSLFEELVGQPEWVAERTRV
jgi:hypothetical protein